MGWTPRTAPPPGEPAPGAGGGQPQSGRGWFGLGRRAARWYRTQSPVRVVGLWAGAAATAALLATTGGYQPGTPALATALTAAAVWVAVRWTGLAATVLVLGVALSLAPSSALVYATGAAGLSVDLGGAVAATGVLLIIGALVAHRLRPRRAWVTVLAVCVAVVVVGPLLVQVVPQAGFAWAWGLEALVLWVASGQPRRLLATGADRLLGSARRARGSGALPSALSAEQAEALGDAVQQGARSLTRSHRGVVTAWTVDAPQTLGSQWHASQITGFWVAGVPVVGCAMAGPVDVDSVAGLADGGTARNRLLLGLVEAVEAASPSQMSTGVDTLIVAIDAVHGCSFKTAMLHLTNPDSDQGVTVVVADLVDPLNVARAVSMATQASIAG